MPRLRLLLLLRPTPDLRLREPKGEAVSVQNQSLADVDLAQRCWSIGIGIVFLLRREVELHDEATCRAGWTPFGERAVSTLYLTLKGLGPGL